MSWSGDSDNGAQNVSNDAEFNRRELQLKQKIFKTRNIIQDTAARFQRLKIDRSDLSSIEPRSSEIKELVKSISKELNALEGFVPREGISNQLTRMKLEEHRREVTNIINIARNLLSEVQIEFNKRQLERNKEQSIISNVHDSDSDYPIQQQRQQEQPSYQEIQEAQEDERRMGELTRDIITLEELFRDCSVKIYEQGETINKIESNTEAAYHNVDNGVIQLAKAEEHKRSITRKKLIIILIVVCALAVIALIIGLSVGLNK